MIDGQPSVGLAIYQLPGTNALDVADRVQAKMRDLKSRFPDGLEYQIGYDTTPFISESITDVVHTLFEAIALVAIVVLVFLQNWRATIIPLVAVPVAIMGTFAVMQVLGFSLNNISLFGLVLAIGIVVDDAIVVVENVERWIEKGMPPREAARRAMDEVTSPVIAVAVVLCAVFVPCAFITGISGQFFRQFAVTIAVSTVISAFNSLDAQSCFGGATVATARRAARSVGPPVELFSGVVFPAVRADLRRRHEHLRPLGGLVFAVGRDRVAGLRGLAGGDLCPVQSHADGIYSAAGSGLAASERATARLDLGAADAGNHATGRTAGPCRPRA